jgi:hypothetical protein
MAFVSWGPRISQFDHSEKIKENHCIKQGNDGWRMGGGEVRDVVEDMIKTVWKDIENVEFPERFDVMTYFDAMTRVSAIHSAYMPAAGSVIYLLLLLGSTDPISLTCGTSFR